jgi:hypothetical protein
VQQLRVPACTLTGCHGQHNQQDGLNGLHGGEWAPAQRAQPLVKGVCFWLTQKTPRLSKQRAGEAVPGFSSQFMSQCAIQRVLAAPSCSPASAFAAGVVVESAWKDDAKARQRDGKSSK